MPRIGKEEEAKKEKKMKANAFEQALLDKIKPANNEQTNRESVLLLYEALESRNAERVQKLLAPDLDWWFHGPRSCHHMKRLLTGEREKFHFFIHSVHAFGPKVIAEGTDLVGSVFWVHAWTISNGIITQVREYFNTCVTVTRVGGYGLPVWQSTMPESIGKSLPGLVLAI